jgi:hypothetical protein
MSPGDLRNDVIHHDGKEKFADSVLFLSAYQTLDSCVSSEPVCANDTRSTVAKSTDYPNWSAPLEGWIKLNTDGSFLAKDSLVGARFINCDHLARTCSRHMCSIILTCLFM